MHKTNVKIVVVAALIICGLVLLSLFMYNNTFRVVSASPENNSTIPSITFSAEIKFSESLKKVGDVSKLFTTKNPEIVYGYEQKGSSLIINFKSLGIDKDYSFQLQNVESVSGRIIKSYQYNLKTVYVPYNQLPAALQQKAMERTDPTQGIKKITGELPVDISPIFRIDYGVSKKYPNDPTKIALYIRSDNPADKVSALQYIYGMGYDPSDYEIVFRGL